MDDHRTTELDALAHEALTSLKVLSAAIFTPRVGGLALAGAAGIDGAALDGLVAAVQNPAHPVARALTDPGPTFDVPPMNPGGPKLRSHLPIRLPGDGATTPALGVLALAHEVPMAAADQAALSSLARQIGGVLDGS